MEPLLWPMVIFTAGSAAAAYGDRDVAFVFSYLAVAAFAAYALTYLWFAIKNPTRLQSEEHQQFVIQKGHSDWE